jgi:DNA (cytosine-5)-methyltransferase 1
VKQALACAFLAKHNGGHEPPGLDLRGPIHTITTKDHHHLVASHLLHLRGSGPRAGRSMGDPLPTITAGGTHVGEVRAFLQKYNRTGGPRSLGDPFDTLTTKHRYGIVYVHGEPYTIADIGQRMLESRELFRGNGFDDRYVIDPVVEGKRLSKTAQVRMCGNVVCPPLAAALVAANVTLQRRTVVA